jgi:hypothetical protein
MLVPHRGENAEFREGRHPPDQFQDALVLVRLQAVLGDEFGGDLGFVPDRQGDVAPAENAV